MVCHWITCMYSFFYIYILSSISCSGVDGQKQSRLTPQELHVSLLDISAQTDCRDWTLDPANVSQARQLTRLTLRCQFIRKKKSTNCLIDAQSVVVKSPTPPGPRSPPDTASVSLRPGGYLCSSMSVRGLGPRAVRSAFHGRQHKVIRRRPTAGAALRSLSCPHSFSVSRCPALTSHQNGTALDTGPKPSSSSQTHSQLNSYI